MRAKPFASAGLALCFIVTFGASSYAQTASARLRNDVKAVEQQRIQQGVFTGAVAGAAVGAVVGGLASRNGSGALVGGLAGLVVGGVIGQMEASRVNDQTAKQTAQRNNYKKMISDADRNIESYRRLNATASALVDEETPRIAKLNDQYQAGQITAEQYKREMASSSDNLKLLQKARNRLNTDIGVLDKGNSDESKARAAQLRQQRDQLDQQLGRLRTAYDRVPAAIGPVS